MSSEKYLVIVILAVVVTKGLAKPSGIPLSIVKDKTICRTVVDYDENENRIPRVIKVLRCAPDPYEMCPASSGSEVHCCGGFPLANGAQFTCTEVLDTVLVSDTNETTYTMNVPIGCSCIKQDPNQATE